jgi:hypothetical protein
MRPGRFPARTVRDLIGLVRSLYFFWQADGVYSGTLEELLRAGRDLRDALELALRSQPDTEPYRLAWENAERATAALCALIEAHHPGDSVALGSRRGAELVAFVMAAHG